MLKNWNINSEEELFKTYFSAMKSDKTRLISEYTLLFGQIWIWGWRERLDWQGSWEWGDWCRWVTTWLAMSKPLKWYVFSSTRRLQAKRDRFGGLIVRESFFIHVFGSYWAIELSVDKCDWYSDCMQAFCTYALKTVEKNVIDFIISLSTETLPNIKLPTIIK